MGYILAGIGVLVAVSAWMVVIIQAGWSDAWWWFEWRDFKFVMLPFLILAGLLIGRGIQLRRRARRSNS